MSAAKTLDVTDVETLTVAIAMVAISENAGAGATNGTVARSNTDNRAALLMTLTSSDTTEDTVPVTVTIPAGQSSATFESMPVSPTSGLVTTEAGGTAMFTSVR